MLPVVKVDASRSFEERGGRLDDMDGRLRRRLTLGLRSFRGAAPRRPRAARVLAKAADDDHQSSSRCAAWPGIYCFEISGTVQLATLQPSPLLCLYRTAQSCH